MLNLGENNVIVILDNHLTKPEWCCSNTDGNGFFGDTYFHPDVWIQGLQKMAALFHDASNVVGMSLRNAKMSVIGTGNYTVLFIFIELKIRNECH